MIVKRHCATPSNDTVCNMSKHLRQKRVQSCCNKGYWYRPSHDTLLRSLDKSITLCRADTCVSWRHVSALATPCGEEEGAVATLLNCHLMCWQTYRHKGAALLSTRHDFSACVLGADASAVGPTMWQVLSSMSPSLRLAAQISKTVTARYTGCPRRNVPEFGRVFLMLNYTDITQYTYVQSWTVTEIMAREVWNFDSCYTLIDYQIHIKTGRNMLFL